MEKEIIAIPELIEGIPTDKKRVKERFDLIKSYYEIIWKNLQWETGKNIIHNEFLDVDVRKVVENAQPLEGMPLFASVKEGVQKKNGYKNMILLYYKFENEEKTYLNFTVKVTIGVTALQKHIQYSVNKVEVNTK